MSVRIRAVLVVRALVCVAELRRRPAVFAPLRYVC